MKPVSENVNAPRKSIASGKTLAVACVAAACLSTVLAGCALKNSSQQSAQAEAASTEASTTGVAGGIEAGIEGIVLFMGDGMGVSTVTAARIYAGQKLGKTGEEHELRFEGFPDVALIKTYNTDMQVPDSAGTMSAIATGVKTRAGVLSIEPSAERGDCAAALSSPVTTLLETMEMNGLRTGLISTAGITHATPAANYAHSADRNWESDSEMPADAKAAGCRDIAAQLVEFAQNTEGSDGIDVILGGGRSNFFPADTKDPEYPDKTGNRIDGRDLSAEWLAGGDNRTYVWNTEQFEAAAGSAANKTPGQVFGLFEPSHMQFDADRDEGPSGEPSLAEMTAFAIKRLRALSNGRPFFLMVEAGRIDHAHHFNNAYRALEDTIALDAAVGEAQQLLGDDSLIIVTADHSHVFTISGYPKRGNPMLGLVRGPDGELLKDINDQPYTTLGYANGSSAIKLAGERKSADGALPTLTDDAVLAEDYQQRSLVPLRAETHAGEDVAAYGTGPGSRAIRGVMEQNKLFDVMRAVLSEELLSK